MTGKRQRLVTECKQHKRFKTSTTINDLPLELISLIFAYTVPSLVEYSAIRLVSKLFNLTFITDLQSVISRTRWSVIVCEDIGYCILGENIYPPAGNCISVYHGCGDDNALALYNLVSRSRGYIKPSEDFTVKIFIDPPWDSGFFVPAYGYSSTTIYQRTSIMSEDDSSSDADYEDPHFDFLSLSRDRRVKILGDYDLLSYTYEVSQSDEEEYYELSAQAC